MRSLDLFKIGTVFLKLISNSFPPSPSPVLYFLAVLIFFFFDKVQYLILRVVIIGYEAIICV